MMLSSGAASRAASSRSGRRRRRLPTRGCPRTLRRCRRRRPRPRPRSTRCPPGTGRSPAGSCRRRCPTATAELPPDEDCPVPWEVAVADADGVGVAAASMARAERRPCSRGWRTARPSAARPPSPTGWPHRAGRRCGDGAGGRPGGPDHRGRGRVDAADADAGVGRAAQADRKRQVGRELGGLRMTGPGDQAVGDRPNREGCGHPRGRDGLACPLAGRLVRGLLRAARCTGRRTGRPGAAGGAARRRGDCARRGRPCWCRCAWCLRSRIPLRRSTPGYAVTRGETLARPNKR